MGLTDEQTTQYATIDRTPAQLYLQDQTPAHKVTITNAFFMGVTEVTKGQFAPFCDDTKYQTECETNPRGGRGFDLTRPLRYDTGFVDTYSREFSWRNVGFKQTDQHPVVNVTWGDATAFCEWLSKKEGLTYELPTEAQWEYACRANSTTQFHNGDDPNALVYVDNVADRTAHRVFGSWKHVNASDGYVYTAPVGRFRPNPFGLYDLHGNVSEWCRDHFTWYTNEDAVDPIGSSDDATRVVRGGKFSSEARLCRSSYRWPSGIANYSYAIGFRVVRKEE